MGTGGVPVRPEWAAAVACAALWGGCCSQEAPSWGDVPPVVLTGGSATVELVPLVRDDRPGIVFSAVSDPQAVLTEIIGTTLHVTPQPGWEDTTEVRVTATDRCDNVSSTDILIDGTGGSAGTSPDCTSTLTWRSSNDPDAVSIAGTFNDWDTAANPLTRSADGTWSVTLELAPGSYPYKFVELDPGLFEDEAAWACDPDAPFIQCDADYKDAWDTTWTQDCTPGARSCNSLLVVPSCVGPRLEVTSLDIDRDAGALRASLALEGAAASVTATLDGVPVEAVRDGDGVQIALEGLSRSRHTLVVEAEDDQGRDAAPVHIPFWLDDFAWEDAVLYFAFLDRVANGDPTNDAPAGASAPAGEWHGGDLAGLIDMLPYLDDLGVDVLWLSNLQDNAEGAWPGDCDETFAAYHAYWPDDPEGIEEHFGTETDAGALVDAAHARGMRVIMDWVANHVHETHPYYQEHPEWFNRHEGCRDMVDGQLNFDRIPESCWFAPYLPDIDYTQPEPLTLLVDDAISWAKRLELDGFRMDAVKHMPHAVAWNLSSAVRREIEHTAVGGDERFWLVGETFDGPERIRAYLGEEQLDSQFDFPLYNAVRGAFLNDSVTLPGLMAALTASQETFGDALMSTFLGNHDVMRFVTEGAEGWQDVCDGGVLRTAAPPADPWAYDRLSLAWTFLLTQPGVPLLYYGDELGMPGYPDPDNRQPLWWHAADPGTATGVEDLASRLQPHQARVLRHVAALLDARRSHPALRRGGWREWWMEDALFGYARSAEGDHALVVLNRSEADRQLDNILDFAGLPSEGTYEDVLTGDVFVAAGNWISVPVPARGSRVLVHRQ